MSVTITLNSITPATVPTDGWIVEYSIKGRNIWVTAPGSPFKTLPKSWTTNDEEGTLYDIRVTRDCGNLNSTPFIKDTPCNCSKAGDGLGGWSVTPDGLRCFKAVTTNPVTSVTACFVANQNGSYSGYGMRVYKPGFTANTLFTTWKADNALIYKHTDNKSYSETAPQWKGKDDGNPGTAPFQGPMNRSGIWISSLCNGIADVQKDASGATAALVVNSPTAKTVYIGVAADNDFLLKLNTTKIVRTQDAGSLAVGSDHQFRMWHILPVDIPAGTSTFNIEVVNASGAEKNPASMAMIVYDNTPTQLYNAQNDQGLTILADSRNLITPGPPYVPKPVITCPPGYAVTYDSNGNPYCGKVLTDFCNESVADAFEDCTFTKTFTHATFENYIYQDTYFDFTGKTVVTLWFNVGTDRPNRITMYDDTAGIQVASTSSIANSQGGWVGSADWAGGSWIPPLNTSLSGSFTFNPVAGHIYKLRIEAGGADPNNQVADACSIYFTCV